MQVQYLQQDIINNQSKEFPYFSQAQKYTSLHADVAGSKFDTDSRSGGQHVVLPGPPPPEYVLPGPPPPPPPRSKSDTLSTSLSILPLSEKLKMVSLPSSQET